VAVGSKAATTWAIAVRTLGRSCSFHWKGTLLIVPYAGPASSQYRPRCGVDKEQFGRWCRLALKSAVAGSFSQVQRGGFWRRASSGW
jgi:hypothetical protein